MATVILIARRVVGKRLSNLGSAPPSAAINSAIGPKTKRTQIQGAAGESQNNAGTSHKTEPETTRATRSLWVAGWRHLPSSHIHPSARIRVIAANRVEPSRSVNRNVTVPKGSSAIGSPFAGPARPTGQTSPPHFRP